MDILERIQELMAERGWTVNRLAKESGLPQSTVSNLFTRGTLPTVPTLEQICRGLGVSLSQFFADGPCVSLTAEQQLLLDRWSTLSGEQKASVLDLLAHMNQ